NQKDPAFIKKMNLTTSAVIINQTAASKGETTFKLNGKNTKFICSTSKGLSNSRNAAIQNSDAEYCILTDDDVIFDDDYEEKVLKAYQEYPEADIIAFQVERIGNPLRTKKFRKKKSWENYISSMKIS